MYNKDKVVTIPKYGLIASIMRSSFFEIPPFLHFFRVQKIHTNALEHVFNIFLMMIMKAIVSVPANYKANPRGISQQWKCHIFFLLLVNSFRKKEEARVGIVRSLFAIFNSPIGTLFLSTCVITKRHTC